MNETKMRMIYLRGILSAVVLLAGLLVVRAQETDEQ